MIVSMPLAGCQSWLKGQAAFQQFPDRAKYGSGD
jgi:hypothetical protein